MADAGYGTAHNYIYAQEHQADVILRITPKNFCLYDTDGNKISLVQLLKEAEKGRKKWWMSLGFVNTGQKLPLDASLLKNCQKDRQKKQGSEKKEQQ